MVEKLVQQTEFLFKRKPEKHVRVSKKTSSAIRFKERTDYLNYIWRSIKCSNDRTPDSASCLIRNAMYI